MIAFDSLEGAMLRALNPSRSAVLSLWFAAVSEGKESWAAWAAEKAATSSHDAEFAALRFLQAAGDGNESAARQLWTILASFPITDMDSRIVLAARNLRSSLPF